MAKARFFAYSAAIFLSLLLFAGSLAAQPSTGNIYGKITDEDGIGLPNVKVTLSAAEIQPLSTETNPAGSYRIALISPGIKYEITAELDGYKTTTKKGVVVQALENTKINITLERVTAVVSKWRAAKVAFNRLVEEPSPLTTGEFFLSISGTTAGDKTEILDYVLGPDISEFMPDIGRFSVVIAEMLNGDLSAARCVIRILGFVENEWPKPPVVKLTIRGRLGASLGVLMRANPGLFLRACHEERESSSLKEGWLPYGYVPFILHMKKSMVSYDMEMRKMAVQSVEDPELLSIRDECLYWIENGTKYMEINALEKPVIELSDGKGTGTAQETVKNVLLEMMDRPSSENMKKVLPLFTGPERPFLEAALFPLISIPGQDWPPQKPCPDPLEIILHEAACGNTYAIEIVFTALLRAFRGWDDLASQILVGFISDLILRNPAVFIENAAKFSYLESERLDTVPITFLDWICETVDLHMDLVGKAKETIFRRRIAALEALDMPEHKELIDRCIGLIEKNLK